MKKRIAILCLLTLCTVPLVAQTVLSIDFSERVFDQSTNTANNYPGFDTFLINSNTSITAVQSGDSTRTFAGGLTVTLAGVGTTVTYDDRLRAAPVNSGAFTQGALLRDFVFNGSTANGDGLGVTINGLLTDTFYKVTIWSYDNSSAGNRVSDWTANGVTVKSAYTFNGSTLPTSDTQYQFNFTITADGTGTIAIQGRRNPATASAGGVFINAITVEIAAPEPPLVTTPPTGVELYQGDNAIFSVQASGSQPFGYQWLFNGTNFVTNGVNGTLVVSNAQPANAGQYSVIVSNVAGSVTSAPATLIVRTVTNITSGLLAYWPLNELTDSTPDLSGNNNTLWATNMDDFNIVDGRRANAPTFNGTDEFLTRTNAPGGTLPAYAYPAYSVTLWVLGNFSGQADRRVFSESSFLNNSPLMTIGTDQAATNASVDIFIRNDNGGNPLNHRKSILPAFDGNWHHIAWVDNNGFAQLYVDGVRDTMNFNYTRGALTPNIDTLGAVYRTNAQALFNGMIDDAAVWRRALNQSEVQYVMNNGAVAPPPRLITGNSDGTNVFLTFFSPIPNGIHYIEITTNLADVPIIWTEITNVIYSVNGNDVTAQFAPTESPQGFYRVRE